MNMLLNLPLLLLTLFSATALTASAPATTDYSSSIIQPIDDVNGTLTSPITCFPKPRSKYYIPPPYFQNCAQALRQLPQTEAIGTFHTHGAYDQYRLPITKSSGPCTVLVETANGGASTDQASWLLVHLAAVELSMGCAPVSDAAPGYGGTTLTGASGRVKITLMQTTRVGNTTAELETS